MHIINPVKICFLIELLSPGRVLVDLFHYSIVDLVDQPGLSNGYHQHCLRSIRVSANIHECLRHNNIQFDKFIRDNCVCRRSQPD